MEVNLAQPTTIKGGKLRVLLDPAGNGSYAAPCGFTSRSVTINKALNEVPQADCDDPDAVVWLARDAVSLSMSISGEGLLARESASTWTAAARSPNPIAGRVEIEFSDQLITYTGMWHVETFDFSGANAQRVTANVSMQSDGEITEVIT